MATHDDIQQEPAPAKKSSGSKVLLILGTIAGLCLVVCCGGLGIGYFVVKDKIKDMFHITTEAAEVKQETQEVVGIQIPESYAPLSAMTIKPGGMFTMRMIIYQGSANGEHQLLIMEMDQPGTNPKQMREQMLQQMRAQQGQGGGGFNAQINADSTETKKFKINGEDVEFDFVKGTRPGNPTVVRQVVGTFPGRKGTILLMLITPESQYDEDAVIKMITSIRVPGSESATEALGESATEEGMPEKDDASNKDAENAPDKTE